jgi:putative ABC transport system permease protein
VVAVSGRLPVTLLIGVRQLARRPRRALLGAASVGVTVTGVVAILTSSANAPSAGAGAISNLKIERLDELMQIITVMLVILAGLNTTFIGWATATDGRFTTALQRALGATRRQVTAGLSIAALIPALPAGLVGVPLGILVYHLLDQGSSLVTPPVWELLGVVLASSFAVVLLTAIPSRWGSQRAPAQILQSL